MRTFVSSDTFIANKAWHDASGAPSHVRQFNVLLVAKTKQAGIDLLTGMGLSAPSAAALVKDLRATARLSRDWGLVGAEGALDLDQPGLYIHAGAQHGKPVVRAVSVDKAQRLGVFDYSGRGLVFDPA